MKEKKSREGRRVFEHLNQLGRGRGGKFRKTN